MTAVPIRVDGKLLIGASWLETGEWLDVVSPYSGERVCRVAVGGAAQARAAVDAAQVAMARPLPAHERAEILARTAALLIERNEYAARILG